MNKKIDELTIDGEIYVPKNSLKKEAEKKDGLDYCIVRTYSAGVFAGYYDRKNKGQEGTIYNARRIYYWTGSATLSQLSQDGSSSPDTCKFPEEVEEVDLKQIIEVIPCTEKARLNIASVSIWKN
jgi:hypothetical protein